MLFDQIMMLEFGEPTSEIYYNLKDAVKKQNAVDNIAVSTHHSHRS